MGNAIRAAAERKRIRTRPNFRLIVLVTCAFLLVVLLTAVLLVKGVGRHLLPSLQRREVKTAFVVAAPANPARTNQAA